MVKSQKTQFVFHEKVKINIVSYLVSNFYELPLDTTWPSEYKEYLLSSLIGYKKRAASSSYGKKGYVRVTYGLGNKWEDGRLYPKVKNIVTLANMPRSFRHTLASGIYIDLDFKNCHPEILLQYCKKNDIKYFYLCYYCENRAKFLEEQSAAL